MLSEPTSLLWLPAVRRNQVSQVIFATSILLNNNVNILATAGKKKSHQHSSQLFRSAPCSEQLSAYFVSKEIRNTHPSLNSHHTPAEMPPSEVGSHAWGPPCQQQHFCSLCLRSAAWLCSSLPWHSRTRLCTPASLHPSREKKACLFLTQDKKRQQTRDTVGMSIFSKRKIARQSRER